MGGDYTRLTFDPSNHFAGVRMQQGRVQLDSDWNELVDIFERRNRAQGLDTFGPCAVPRETPDAFKIRLVDGAMTIGVGRVYVDGLLAENQGSAMATVDPLLGELRGSEPIPYEAQPFSPQPPALPASGAGIAYLEVWQREVTAIQDPNLVERALGVDTATRLQSAWRVRVRPIAQQYLAAGDVEGSPEWQSLIAAPSGRLSSVPVGGLDDAPPAYTGGENRLYRIELHDSGPAGTATFKWSSTNGSVVSAVVAISHDRTQLTVARVERDRVVGIQPGDWVEVIDDELELAGEVGVMALVQGVDSTAGLLRLASELPEDLFDPSATERHTRVRRWDQKGSVVDASGREYVNLDVTDGVIPVPTDSAMQIVLEDGIAVSFSGGAPHPPRRVGGRPRTRVVAEEELVTFFEGGVEALDVEVLETSPHPGRPTRRRHQASHAQDYRSGDYWTFAARSDGWLEVLDAAPPRGVWRHYCPLAIVNFPDFSLDLRVMWPPPELTRADRASGAISVTATGHNDGTFTIQQAIDRVKGTGGHVSLGPGLFWLAEPLDVTRTESIRLTGSGWATVLLYDGTDTAVRVEQSVGVTIEELTVLSAARGLAAGARQALSVLLPRGLSGTAADVLTSLQTIGSQHSSESACCLTLGDSADVNVRGCMAIQLADSAAEVPAVALRGLLVNARITENTIVGASGLANREVVGLAMGEQPYLVDAAHAAEASRGAGVPYLVTAGLTVRDNDLWCSRAGISMGGLTLHLFETRIAHNRVWAGQSGGIVLTGATGESAQPGVHRLTVEDNLIRVVGPGIVAGTDRARVRGNVVSPNAALNLGRRAAVDEAATQPARRVPHPESGIVVARGLRLDATDDCEVTGNQVVGIAGHGIVVASATGTLRVEANEVTGVGGMGIEMAPGSAGQHMVIRANRLHDVIRIPRNGTLPAAAVRLHDIAHVEVLENMVDGVGQTALGTAGRDGIQLSGSGSRIVRVRGNDLRGFGVSGSALPDSAGVSIDGTAPSAEVDVSTNVVRLSTTPVAPAWRALRIGMPLAPSIEQQIRRAAVGPIGVLEGLIRSTVLRQPPGQATPQAATVGAGAAPAAQALISVRGNLLEALGPAPTVEINVAGVCTFADNQCLRADSQFSTSTIISLQADAAIFTGNHVRGGGQFAADINTRTNGQVNQAWSVVGNVSVQGVRINGGTGNSSANVNSIAGIGVPTVAEPAAGAPSTRSTG